MPRDTSNRKTTLLPSWTSLCALRVTTFCPPVLLSGTLLMNDGKELAAIASITSPNVALPVSVKGDKKASNAHAAVVPSMLGGSRPDGAVIGGVLVLKLLINCLAASALLAYW